MEAPWLTPTYDISYSTISRQVNDHGFLGLQRDYIDKLEACWYLQENTMLANAIKQLRVEIKEKKRRGKLSAGFLHLHENAPMHKPRAALAAIRESTWFPLYTEGKKFSNIL